MFPLMESMDNEKLTSPVQESRELVEPGFSVQESEPYFNLSKSSAFSRTATMIEEIQKAVSAETKTEQKEAEWVGRCPIVDSGGQETLTGNAANTGLPDDPKDTFKDSRLSGGSSKRRKRRKKRSVKKSMVSAPLHSPSRIPGLLQDFLMRGLTFLPLIVFMVFMLTPVESTSQTSRHPRHPHSLTSAPAHSVNAFHKYIFCNDSLKLTNEIVFIHIHLTTVCNFMADGSHTPKKCNKRGVTVNQVNDSCLIMQTVDTVEKLYFMNVGEKSNGIRSKPAGQFPGDVPERSDSYKTNGTAPGDKSEPGAEPSKRSLWSRHLFITCVCFFTFVILLTIITYVCVRRRRVGNGRRSVEESEPTPAVLLLPIPSPTPEEGLLGDDEHNHMNGIQTASV